MLVFFNALITPKILAESRTADGYFGHPALPAYFNPEARSNFV